MIGNEIKTPSVFKEAMTDSNGKGSGKRVFGGIGMSFYLIATTAISVFSVYTGNDIGVNASRLLTSMGISCASLLGIGVVEGFAQAKKLREEMVSKLQATIIEDEAK